MTLREEKGGSIHFSDDTARESVASVETVTVERKSDDKIIWIVTLRNAIPGTSEKPGAKIPKIGDKLIYNSKGTHNPNADNDLTVTSIIGPVKYKCTGNWPYSD